MSTQRYAAHVVAEDAKLGDPQVIVMTWVSEPWESGEVVETHEYHQVDPTFARDELLVYGWRTIGEWTLVSHGYAIVEVEKV